MSAQRTPGPWTVHNGGGRPHSPLTFVEVRLRDGQTYKSQSGFIRWVWDDDASPDDVIEWREVPRPASKEEIISELLEALELVLKRCGPNASDRVVAEAAIAKARGA